MIRVWKILYYLRTFCKKREAFFAPISCWLKVCPLGIKPSCFQVARMCTLNISEFYTMGSTGKSQDRKQETTACA